MALRDSLRGDRHRRSGLHISTGIDKAFFESLLALFAAEPAPAIHPARARQRSSWHAPANLVVPHGIRLEFLPPYSPELQPAERLWPLLGEPFANRNFATLEDLDAVLADRCRALSGMRQSSATIRASTGGQSCPMRTNQLEFGITSSGFAIKTKLTEIAAPWREQ